MKYIELILILMVVGSSVASWIVKTLKEQSEARRQQMGVERAREDALRTGRNLEALEKTAEPPQTAKASTRSADERLREIMAERQRRIEELRQRAQAEAQARARAQAQQQGHMQGQMQTQPRGQGSTRSGQAAPGRAQGSGAAREMILIGPDGVPRTVRRPAVAASVRQRAGMDAATEEKMKKERASRLQAEQSQAWDEARAREDVAQAALERQTAASLAADARRAAVVPGVTGRGVGTQDRLTLLGGPIGPAELRRAIVLNEILSPPSALRDEL